MGSFKALRERRLFQFFTLYLAGGWAALQVVDQLANRAIVPDIVYQIVFIWFIAGIPAALLIGWHHGEKGRQRAPLSEVIILVLLAIAASGFSGSSVVEHREEIARRALLSNPLESRGVAVRYFENVGDSAYAYLADGLTETLIDELQQVSALRVSSRNASEQFRDPAIGSDSVARALKVATIVEGDVDVRGDKLKVNLRLLDQAGATYERTVVQGDVADIETLRTSMVTEIARLLRRAIGEELRVRERSAETQSSDAWALVHRAEKARKDAELRNAEGDAAGMNAAFMEADRMLEQAEGADPRWEEPVVNRAAIAYRRAYLAQRDPAEAMQHVRVALGHAERALAMDGANARALEVRGTANYFSWLLRTAPTAEAHAALRETAITDLAKAVELDPTLASAHATLSHAYYSESITRAVMAAQRAFEQDAYLENADVVVWRLFTGSLELQDFKSAKRWCTEGRRRFSGDYRFEGCELRLMATPSEQADIAQAWAAVARMDSVTPERRKAFEQVRAQITMAAIIARAGRQDSARSVLNRAVRDLTPATDPTGELILTEAYARILTGERERAIALLERYAAANPDAFARSRGEMPWWYRDVQDDQRVKKLFGLN